MNAGWQAGGRWRCSTIASLISVAWLPAAGTAVAHHSYAAFDRTREVTVQGTVRTWEMGNPHAYLWLYVKNRQGKQDIWGFEGPSPAALVSHGWSKYSVKVGDAITVTMNPLRDGRNGGSLTSVRLADGRFLDAHPNDQKPPAQPRNVPTPATAGQQP